MLRPTNVVCSCERAGSVPVLLRDAEWPWLWPPNTLAGRTTSNTAAVDFTTYTAAVVATTAPLPPLPPLFREEEDDDDDDDDDDDEDEAELKRPVASGASWWAGTGTAAVSYTHLTLPTNYSV